MAIPVQPALPGRKATLDREALRVVSAHKDQREIQEPRDHKVLKATKAIRVILELLAETDLPPAGL
jgi:hypothetical protein